MMRNRGNKKRKIHVFHDDDNGGKSMVSNNGSKKRLTLNNHDNDRVYKKIKYDDDDDLERKDEKHTMLTTTDVSENDVVIRLMGLFNTLDINIYNFLKKCCFNGKISSSDILLQYLKSTDKNLKCSLRHLFSKNSIFPTVLRNSKLLSANAKSFHFDVVGDTVMNRSTDGIISLEYSHLDTLDGMTDPYFIISKETESFLKSLIQSTYDFCEFNMKYLRASSSVNMISILFSSPKRITYFSNYTDGNYFRLNVTNANINDFIDFFKKATSLHCLTLIELSMTNLSELNQRSFYNAIFRCRSLKVFRIINGVNINMESLFKSLREHSHVSRLKTLSPHCLGGLTTKGCIALCEYIQHFDIRPLSLLSSSPTLSDTIQYDTTGKDNRNSLTSLDLSGMKITDEMLNIIGDAFNNVKNNDVKIISDIGLGSNLFKPVFLGYFLRKSQKHIKSLNYYFSKLPDYMMNEEDSVINVINVILNDKNPNLLKCKMCFDNQTIFNLPLEKLDVFYNWNILSCGITGFGKPDFIKNIHKRNRDFLKMRKSFHFWTTKRNDFSNRFRLLHNRQMEDNDQYDNGDTNKKNEFVFDIGFMDCLSDVSIICYNQ